MAKLKAGEYGVRVFGGRISAATELANSLASNTSASEAITATATAAKALTAGVAQLNSMLQKIQGDLGQVDSNLQTANRSLGDTNARLKTNQNALAAIPRDSLNILRAQEQEDVDKANKNLAKKRTELNKKISNDQANASALTAKITLLNQQKWSFSVLANRILQSINKINTTHDTLIPVRDKLVSYNESAGLGYLKFSFLAQESYSTFENLWKNLSTMDNESRFNIYNASIANLMSDKSQDGLTLEESAPELTAIGAQIKAENKVKVDALMAELDALKKEQARIEKIDNESNLETIWNVTTGNRDAENDYELWGSRLLKIGGAAGALAGGLALFGVGTGAGATSAAATGTVTTTSSGLLVADAGVVGGGSLAGSGTATTLAELGIGAGTSTAGTGGLTIAGAGTVGAGSSTALSTAGTATTLTELGISGTATTSVSTAAATASELSAATSAYQTALSRLSAASEYLQAVKATPGVTQSAIANAQALVNNLKPGLQSAFEVLTKLTH